MALACSLTAEPPATLPPRQPNSTITPQSPIGPQGTVLSPTQHSLPPSLPTSPPIELPTNTSIADQLNFVDGNRMMNTIVALMQFNNRHALSPFSVSEGIHAARGHIFTEFNNISLANPDVPITVSEQEFGFTFAGTIMKARM